ncbi:MAG: M20/M25/M40 family metallo-hydrolase, partial [Bacteroidales bacterium]|nr:M20/M25/M40 family metallo-hydrolase [Bacteroidales bacterium]
GIDRANEIARAKLAEIGLSAVRIETAREFSRGGWDNSKAYAAMTKPYYNNFAITPVAWTAGTNGPVKGEVVLVDITKAEDLEQYRGKLKGSFVITPSSAAYEVSYEPLAERYTQEQLENLEKSPLSDARRAGRNFGDWRAMRELRGKISAFMAEEGVALMISSGRPFNVPSSTGAQYDGGSKLPITEISIPQEPYGRMERLLKNGEKVEMEVEINSTLIPGKEVYNVIAEIPGTDPKLKDEVVLLGGHIDSWHGGTGAADDASGCIVMMEAIRILKALDVKPRRTIRIALWGGEEQGLNGSRGYVEKYLYDAAKKERKPAYDRFSVYFNMDNGTGRYRGIYLQENELARPLFEAWMKPYEDMEFATISNRNTGGTDHLSFDGVGLPGFQFIQDEIEYGRGYHTNTDTWERLLLPDLRQNAIITAWFAYNAAMMNDRFPREPEMTFKQQPRGF